MTALSPRQESILNRIVEAHIETAQPVGSRFITDLYTDLYRAFYSPATVRYEMGVLEEKGYLTHPHTSAGRVPTDLGYRFYVDNSLKEEEPAEQVKRQISRDLSQAAEQEKNLMEKMLQILSHLSEELSLIVVSKPSQAQQTIFIQGSSKMLEKPEFQDIAKARSIFQAIDEKASLASWLLNRGSQKEVRVTIGQENSSEAFRDCSVISKYYGAEGKFSGVIAILGPRRMRYNKMVPLVAWMGKLMSSVSNDLEEE